MLSSMGVLTVSSSSPGCRIFFFNDPATTEIYTLSLHDALPISPGLPGAGRRGHIRTTGTLVVQARSEEHTSELQSLRHLVCRLLLEKKKSPGPRGPAEMQHDPYHDSRRGVARRDNVTTQLFC